MRTYNVIGYPEGADRAHFLSEVTLTRQGRAHAVSAVWRPDPREGIEFGSQARAEAIARLVRLSGACDAVDVVTA